METPNIDQLCKKMPQLNINKEHNNNFSKRKRVESDESDDDSLSYLVTPLYESLSSDDESHTSPIYHLEKQVPFPWEVSLVFSPRYLRIDPKLLVHVDKEKMLYQE